MKKPCSIALCHDPAAGYGTLCERHKRISRRHGHPEQTGVTVQELTPYRQRVKQRMEINKGNNAWSILGARWERILAAAKERESVCLSGTPHIAYEREALSELIKVGRDVPVPTVIEVTLAMYLMQQEQPRRFKSDAAFDAQLARRVRGLTDTNAGSYWDAKLQRSKRVYKDIPPRVLAAMAHHIKTAFGVAGVYVAQLEQRESQQATDERAALSAALDGLK